MVASTSAFPAAWSSRQAANAAPTLVYPPWPVMLTW